MNFTSYTAICYIKHFGFFENNHILNLLIPSYKLFSLILKMSCRQCGCYNETKCKNNIFFGKV